jgi:hypothetical protein
MVMVRPFQIALALQLAILVAAAARPLFGLAAGGPLWSLGAGQEAGVEIHAVGRLFPEIGPGLEAVKRDAAGKYYVVAAPAHSVAIFDSDGKRLGQVPNESSQGATIVFAEDIDVDAGGRLLVGDRGANAVKIFGADGSLAATVPVAAPTYVVALLDGYFAVSSLGSTPAINIYNAHGKRVQSFGTLPASPRQFSLDRYESLGLMCGDLAGHIYFAYALLPDPVIRKYDRNGYALYEISLDSDEFAGGVPGKRPSALSLDRREAAAEKPEVNAIGADPATQELWAAMANTLLHFSKDGTRRGVYRTFTPEGARLEPRTILVEPERILLGADPLGIYEFTRPDRPRGSAPAPVH